MNPHQSPSQPRRLSRGSRGSQPPGRYSSHQSPAVGRSPKVKADKRIKDLCQDLKPILGVEPATVFFTEERIQSFERFKDAFQELLFFYCALIRVVLGKSDRIVQHEDNLDMASETIDPAGVSFVLYHGVKLYRLTCSALYALKVKPIPSFLEFGDPSATFLQRVAERLIEWYYLHEKSRAEEMRANANSSRVKADLEGKRQIFNALKDKRQEYQNGDADILTEESKLEDEVGKLRTEISEIYKDLQKKTSESHEIEKKFKDTKDALSSMEHRSLEVQSQNETLRQNIAKSPRRCIKELDAMRTRIETERDQLNEDEKSVFYIAPAIDGNKKVMSKTQKGLQLLENLILLYDEVDGLTEQRLRLEQAYNTAEAEAKELETKVRSADQRLESLYVEVESKVDQLKDHREERRLMLERLNAECVDASRTSKLARENVGRIRLTVKQREDALQKQKVQAAKELNITVNAIEKMFSSIEDFKYELQKKFNDHHHFHSMPWNTFKKNVNAVQHTETSEASDSENHLKPQRKSVDGSISYPIKGRRRSSVLAFEVVEAMLQPADGQSQSLSALGNKMTTEERTKYAKKVVLSQIDRVLTCDGLTSEEMDLRRHLPKKVHVLLEEWRIKLEQETQ